MITTLAKYPTLTAALERHTASEDPAQASAKIVQHIQDKFPTARQIVLFVNQDFSSSKFGAWTCLPIGPDQTYKTLEQIEGSHLFDLPSQRQYPVAYVEIGGTK